MDPLGLEETVAVAQQIDDLYRDTAAANRGMVPSNSLLYYWRLFPTPYLPGGEGLMGELGWANSEWFGANCGPDSLGDWLWVEVYGPPFRQFLNPCLVPQLNAYTTPDGQAYHALLRVNAIRALVVDGVTWHQRAESTSQASVKRYSRTIADQHLELATEIQAALDVQGTDWLSAVPGLRSGDSNPAAATTRRNSWR